MSSRRTSSIRTVTTPDQNLNAALGEIKQNIDRLTGRTRNAEELAELPSTATLAQVIEQLNIIARRMQ